MSSPRATVMVLIPGRTTLCFELNGKLWQGLVALLLMPMMLGATARRCVDSWEGRTPAMASLFSAHPVSGSLLRLERESAHRPSARLAAPHNAAVAAAQVNLVALALAPAQPEPPTTPRPLPANTAGTTASKGGLPKGGIAAIDEARASELARGDLRLDAVHFGEALEVTPFDAGGIPKASAFDALRHLMRCRITGDEAPIDPRLVRILTQLSALYGRSIQLVSGHRKSHAIGTKPTSQHVLGRAADIRIPGVSIEELRTVAIKLGARGVGLYPEKGFVHVDVRDKPKYFWTYSADEGEEADGRPSSGFAPVARHLTAAID